MHTSIPTRFHGRLYRSRLEARYASFFEALGWLAEYEPIDLTSRVRGYIPDFSLAFVREDKGALVPAHMIVEVKPLLMPFDATALAHCRRIDTTWDGDALLVGASHNVTEDETTDPDITIDDDGMFPIVRSGSALAMSGTIEIGRARWQRTAWNAAYLAHDGACWFVSTSDDPCTRLDADHYMHARWSWANAGNDSQWQPRGKINGQ